MSARGYCGIGIVSGKIPQNLGTLWRSADLLGADFVFTVGARYRRQPSDTMASERHMLMLAFGSLDEMRHVVAPDVKLIAVELDESASPLEHFSHPERAVYVLGGEDCGLGKLALAQCDHVVQLPGRFSMNVAAAGTVVLYDRLAKQRRAR